MRSVTQRAVVARINRKLRADGHMRLRKTRALRGWSDLGDFYVFDVNRNAIVRGHVNPEAFARELGVLGDCERVED